MKSAPPPLTIGKVCPMSWSSMQGDSKKRYCEHCQLHVHNLSAMSGRERARFVRESGGRACIAYRLDADGTLITPPSPWQRATRVFREPKAAAMGLLATLLPFLFSACSHTEQLQPTLGVPLPPDTSDTQPKKAGVKEDAE